MITIFRLYLVLLLISNYTTLPYKEKAIVKKYYSIGEIAKMFNVASSLIRFWESEFDIIKPKKNSKGNRQFTVKDIENLKVIFHLVKERGFTLSGAKEMLKNNQHQNIHDKIKMIDDLSEIKAFLIDLKSRL